MLVTILALAGLVAAAAYIVYLRWALAGLVGLSRRFYRRLEESTKTRQETVRYTMSLLACMVDALPAATVSAIREAAEADLTAFEAYLAGRRAGGPSAR